jgi:uncharacterized protein
MKTSALSLISAFFMVTAGFGLTALSLTPAYAQSTARSLVDAAKAKGIVGESRDGYLGYVTAGADAQTMAAVNEINQGRKEVYAIAANKNGVSTNAAAVSAYATVILPKVKSGEFYQDQGGWVKK